MTKTKDAPKVVRSGWCGRSHPDLGDWSHKRCPGTVADATCPCDCHRLVVDMRGYASSDWIDVWGHFWAWDGVGRWVHDRSRCQLLNDEPCAVRDVERHDLTTEPTETEETSP